MTHSPIILLHQQNGHLLGILQKFLGLEINRDNNGIKISQKSFIKKLLNKFNMNDCNSAETPVEVNLKLEKSEPHEEYLFRNLIGSLLFLVLGSRPDLNFAVNYFSQFQNCSNHVHFSYLKRVLRYLQGTLDLELTLSTKSTEDCLIGYADADWGSNALDRKSISGNIFKLYGCPVSWNTKKQSVVALSSTEAELISLSFAAREALWLLKILKDMNIRCDHAKIFEDNQSCIYISKNPIEHQRIKHLDIKYQFILQCVEENIISVIYVNSKNQIADIFTKSLPPKQFKFLRSKLGIL